MEKLRRRAPRQAELLGAILQLTEPIAAAELLRVTSLDNSTLRALVKRGFARVSSKLCNEIRMPTSSSLPRTTWS